MIETHIAPDLLPSDWQGHRCAGARAQRIARDSGGALRIAQIVDEDLAATARFGEVGGEALREGAREQLGHCLGEAFDRIPTQDRLDRHHHMQALAAGGSQKTLQLDFLEQRFNQLRRLNELAPS